jgi:hypothetical protein
VRSLRGRAGDGTGHEVPAGANLTSALGVAAVGCGHRGEVNHGSVGGDYPRVDVPRGLVPGGHGRAGARQTQPSTGLGGQGSYPM